jgi:type II secretory pathway pseudopilin PulG
MKNNLPPRVVSRRGMTLLELTVIIVVMLALIVVLAIGSRAWKRASDRSACVMNVRNLQVATRSYQNLYGYYFGGQPQLEYGTHDISRHLLEKGYISQGLHDQTKGSRPCAGGGTYRSAAPDFFPMPGQLYMNCSLSAAEDHEPEPATAADW